ncbi:uncharacterized protein LOC128551847 [Mercenaria mercenaria]|uniref:uncharacterized protein LOC128551847 n=1 Tax=Mercenaria mercenaria TaxID=6596 RepID=UPI00234E89D2|nr:uncharacterized protein LOC128551847 [Mercenaria mercenaria]
MLYSVLEYLMGQVAVRTDCISDVERGSQIYRIKSLKNEAAEIEKMIQDALLRVGEKSYSIFNNNCHHLCEGITGNGTVPSDIRAMPRVHINASDLNVLCETPLLLSSQSSPGYNIQELASTRTSISTQETCERIFLPFQQLYGKMMSWAEVNTCVEFEETSLINLMNNTGLQKWQGNGTCPQTNFFWSGAKTLLTQDYSGLYIDTINLINNTGLQEWRQGNDTCSLTNSYWGGAKTKFTQYYSGGYIDTVSKSCIPAECIFMVLHKTA